MGGLALLARAAGHTVSGSDTGVYPPMSTLLAAEGVTVMPGDDPACLEPAPDCVVVGNVMSRGNSVIEYMLNRGIPYTSGPQWLAEHILAGRTVLAVAGTHGKTTTASMLAWILDCAGHAPGYLIGGVPEDFGVSARLGAAPFFVVEADEYDTAFFDKRSKFVHYRPHTLVLNNLEFDHADIFPDLASIQRQFHHLVRTVPGNGLIVSNADDTSLDAVLGMGCWTPVQRFGAAEGARWRARGVGPDGSRFQVWEGRRCEGTVEWSLLGQHNVYNALAAIAAARHAGVAPADAGRALARFKSVKRRLELRGVVEGVHVYDDFAHHPTAIAATIGALRARVGSERIIALLEPRSNTMRMGVHRKALAGALAGADQVLLYQPPDLGWDLEAVAVELGGRARMLDDLDAVVDGVAGEARPGDHVLIMSNGAFGGVHQHLIEALARAVESDGPDRAQDLAGGPRVE